MGHNITAVLWLLYVLQTSDKTLNVFYKLEPARMFHTVQLVED